MSDLKNAILDAKYVDMISLADFIVQDCQMPDTAADGSMLPQANEVAAAVFRWAAGAELEAKQDMAQEPQVEVAPQEPQTAPNPWTNTATGVTDTNGS